jgi:hypothetical protein
MGTYNIWTIWEDLVKAREEVRRDDRQNAAKTKIKTKINHSSSPKHRVAMILCDAFYSVEWFIVPVAIQINYRPQSNNPALLFLFAQASDCNESIANYALDNSLNSQILRLETRSYSSKIIRMHNLLVSLVRANTTKTKSKHSSSPKPRISTVLVLKRSTFNDSLHAAVSF